MDPRQIFWGARECAPPRNSLHPHPKKVIINQMSDMKGLV